MEPDKRYKIWFFPRWYPDRDDSMFGLFIRRHAEAVQLKHDVFVLYTTPSDRCNNTYELTENKHDGITEITCYYKKSESSIINLFRYIAGTNKIYNQCIKKHGSPDINHIHVLTRTGIFPLILKACKRIPYVITEHWSRYLPENVKSGSYNGWLRKFFTKLIVQYSSGITTVTKNLSSAMISAGLKHSNYTTIPNVADADLFHPPKAAVENHKKKFVHISCFDEKAKNVKGIIDTIELLLAERQDFQMEIIGDGPDFMEVNNYAQSSNISTEQLYFSGLLEGEQLASRLRNADAFVMFSNYENLPCTICESLISGVPVISSDVGGISEFVGTNEGILVKKQNTSELRDAMNAILKGEKTFDRSSIRNYGIENFGKESISNQFHSLYKIALWS